MKRIICLLFAVLFLIGVCSQTLAIGDNDGENILDEELLEMDPELDSDGDGLPDILEILYGSDRYMRDTDGDEVNDYIEFSATHTDLNTPDGDLDSDSDGICNVDEIKCGTDPGHRDTDGDRLNDYDEIFIYGTNPLLSDTDNDGVYDDDEVQMLTMEFDDQEENEGDCLNAGSLIVLPGGYSMVSFDDSIVMSNAITFPEDFGDGTGTLDVEAIINRIIDGAVYPTDVTYKLDYSHFFWG